VIEMNRKQISSNFQSLWIIPK